MVAEVIAAILVVVLAVVATYMAVYGGLGVIGAIRFVRCPECRHMVPRTIFRPGPCPHCRHAELYHHPLHSLHEAHLLHRLAAHVHEPTEGEPLGR